MSYVPAPHTHGGLRLHLNENTAGCSPAVLAALRGISREEASFYPDYAAMTTATEKWLDVPAGWVQLTNGLDEGLHVVAQSAKLATSDYEAIVVEPAFEMYAASIAAVGGTQVTIPPAPDLSFSLDAVLNALTSRTRLVYLCDPNNPTGVGIPKGAIETLASAAPRATIFVDEAYAEFSGRTMIGPPLTTYKNVVVGRTFAKAHGLAALRMGALIAHPDTLAPLRRILPPYSINVCAVLALGAALNDRGYLEWYVEESAQSRARIYDWCRRHDIFFWPSEANFVLMRVGEDASALTAHLAARGIHIRDKSRAPGCAGCIRITAGVAADTQRCLDEMERWYATRVG